MQSDYINLIRTLSACADEKIYKKCCDIIDNCDSNKKANYLNVFIDILLKFNKKKWKHFAKENIANNSVEKIAYYLEKKIIPFDDDISKAQEIQFKYLKLIKNLFSDVNPIPIKEAMNYLDFDVGPTRLPLSPMDREKSNQLKKSILKLYEKN